MRMQVWSLALLSGLRIQSWHELWYGSQMRLDPTLLWLWCRRAATMGPIRMNHWGLGTATSECAAKDQSLGTSICLRYSPKKTRKKKASAPFTIEERGIWELEALSKKLSQGFLGYPDITVTGACGWNPSGLGDPAWSVLSSCEVLLPTMSHPTTQDTVAFILQPQRHWAPWQLL